MDRPLADNIKRKRKQNVISRILGAALVFIFLIFMVRILITPSIERDEFTTAFVGKGSVEASVSASGTVVPEFEETRISPVQSSITRILRNTGDEVFQGDTILMLDTRGTDSSLEKMQDELNLKRNNMDQLSLQYERNLINLQTEYQIKKLNIENMQAALKEEEYLNSIGGGTGESVKKANLNLQIARLELDQLRQSVDNQQRMMEAELTGLNYEIRIQERNVRDLQEKLKHSTVQSDKKGVITWVNDQIGKNINTGDELIRIANLESYEVIGSISEMHAGKMKAGGDVIVKVSDEVEIRGQIISISPAVSGNVIRFMIRLNENDHPALRPNLRVDVYVITSFKQSVMRIINGAFYMGGARQNVFVLDGNKLLRKEVGFGESNYDYVEVLSGLSENEEVIVSDMSDYDNYQEIRLRK